MRPNSNRQQFADIFRQFISTESYSISSLISWGLNGSIDMMPRLIYLMSRQWTCGKLLPEPLKHICGSQAPIGHVEWFAVTYIKSADWFLEMTRIELAHQLSFRLDVNKTCARVAIKIFSIEREHVIMRVWFLFQIDVVLNIEMSNLWPNAVNEFIVSD